jgi:hypothetical protein
MDRGNLIDKQDLVKRSKGDNNWKKTTENIINIEYRDIS